ncbi:MAG: division/cell wall cluster transcriptional repressor MraZ [Bacteroidales bacterium]|jgi:MraZ protein|nr:division/cell wall cluster transcriptional repressor MraZ [Bacteroidales bacterium]NLM92404.1 division/cell wall cluster transcriptional repressor MraZ [Bacteroidales bacterium]
MTYLLGEFDIKVDSKGRFMLPSGLKKQLTEGDQERFVINRGFEKNLTLYPQSEWQKISQEVNSLNLYNKKNREFVRYFFRGASEVMLDSANRLLLPKSLLEYAGIEKEIVLFAYGQRIEIWAREVYESMMNNEPEDFSSLAEDVMGKITNQSGNEGVS